MSEGLWLASLRAGDSVVVRAGICYSRLRLAVVARVTPKQIAVNGLRYWREDGREIGGNTHEPKCLLQPTPERLVTIRRQHAIERLSSIRWCNLENDVLFKVMDVVQVIP